MDDTKLLASDPQSFARGSTVDRGCLSFLVADSAGKSLKLRFGPKHGRVRSFSLVGSFVGAMPNILQVQKTFNVSTLERCLL